MLLVDVDVADFRLLAIIYLVLLLLLKMLIALTMGLLTLLPCFNIVVVVRD